MKDEAEKNSVANRASSPRPAPETFAEIERERSAWLAAKAHRISAHAIWLTECDKHVGWLEKRTALLTAGLDLARLDRARTIIAISGEQIQDRTPLRTRNDGWPKAPKD